MCTHSLWWPSIIHSLLPPSSSSSFSPPSPSPLWPLHLSPLSPSLPLLLFFRTVPARQARSVPVTHSFKPFLGSFLTLLLLLPSPSRGYSATRLKDTSHTTKSHRAETPPTLVAKPSQSFGVVKQPHSECFKICPKIIKNLAGVRIPPAAAVNVFTVCRHGRGRLLKFVSYVFYDGLAAAYSFILGLEQPCWTGN